MSDRITIAKGYCVDYPVGETLMHEPLFISDRYSYHRVDYSVGEKTFGLDLLYISDRCLSIVMTTQLGTH